MAGNNLPPINTNNALSDLLLPSRSGPNTTVHVTAQEVAAATGLSSAGGVPYRPLNVRYGVFSLFCITVIG